MIANLLRVVVIPKTCNIDEAFTGLYGGGAGLDHPRALLAGAPMISPA